MKGRVREGIQAIQTYQEFSLWRRALASSSDSTREHQEAKVQRCGLTNERYCVQKVSGKRICKSLICHSVQVPQRFFKQTPLGDSIEAIQGLQLAESETRA